MMKFKSLIGGILLAACFAVAALGQGAGQLAPGQGWGVPFGGAKGPAQPVPIRTKLTAPLAMYVNPAGAPATGPTPSGLQTFSTGSDSNNCLSITSPGATATHCAALLGANYDLGGISGNKIYVAHAASWQENVILPTYVGGQPGSHNNVVITGDSTSPSSLVLSPLSGDCVQAITNFVEWGIAYFKIVCAGSSIHADTNSTVTHNGIIFGNANIFMNASGPGSAIEGSPQGGTNSGATFAGNASAFEQAADGGQIYWNQVTVTLSGTPACLVACVVILPGGNIDNAGVTFSGSATGTRFNWYWGGSFNTSAGITGDPNSVTPGSVQGAAPTFSVLAGATYLNVLAQMGNALNVFNLATDGTNANVTMSAGQCPFLVNTAVLSAARTWKLPPANSLPQGTLCTVGDFGGISGADTITVTRAGSDTFFGPGVVSNAYVLSLALGAVTVRTDGSANWLLVGTNQTLNPANNLSDLLSASTARTNLGLPTNLAWSNTPPSVASGFCSSPSISNNNGTAAFTITIGSSCGASTGVLTMPAAPHGWKCDFADITTPASNAPAQSGPASAGTTTVNVTNYVRTTGVAGNWTAADVIAASCTAY